MSSEHEMTEADRTSYWQGAYERMAARNVELANQVATSWNEAIEAAAATAKNDAFPAWRESILRLKRPTGGRMDE